MAHVKELPPVKKVYLIGIGGTAMASLAGMLQERGYELAGSDEHVYPPMSTYLERLGISGEDANALQRTETLEEARVLVTGLVRSRELAAQAA